MELKPGDIILTWGSKLTSRFIRMLEKSLLMIDFPPSHTVMVVDDKSVVSADADVVRIKPVSEVLNNQLKYVVIREKNIEYNEKDIRNEAEKLIGSKYDYYLYLYWTITIILTIFPFLNLFLLPIKKWLEKKKRLAYMCSEVVAMIRYNLTGKDFGIQPIEYTTPIDIYQFALVCEDFEIIYKWEKELTFKDKLLNSVVYVLWWFISLIIFGGFVWLLILLF